jgi:hypothetical protein
MLCSHNSRDVEASHRGCGGLSVMSNPFRVGDNVMHDVDVWKKPTSTLTVTHIKNLVVVATDDSGQKFIGNYGCFNLIGRSNHDS